MAIKIVTDSSCDLPEDVIKELDIDIIPMTVSFGEKEYTVGKDLGNKAFYDLLKSEKELPKTSQLGPVVFEDYYKSIIQNGDSLVLLPISRELSGTYNNAVLAAKEFEDADIHVVDTLSTTFGLGLLVIMAVRYKEQGLNANQIADNLDNIKDKLELYAIIDDLNLLSKGGRLSSAGAVVGSLLGIKPIIRVIDGKVVNIGKVRGTQAGYKYIIEKINETGIDTKYPVFFGHAEIPDAAKQLEEFVKRHVEFKDVYTSSVGPVVGTHIGFGATGVAFIRKD